MFGELNLVKNYPLSWQTSFTRSGHPWILHITIWHYWFLFTFVLVLNLFCIYIYKSLSYNRADVRGTRSTGEKRRIAWPEMLIVILPLYWAINIVINALTYLRVIEGSNGHVIMTVQVNGYQWGWKYSYNDNFYVDFFSNPIKIGVDKTASYSGSVQRLDRDIFWLMENESIYEEIKYEYDIKFDNQIRHYIKYVDEKSMDLTQKFRWRIPFFKNQIQDETQEVYFCRNWLKSFGAIENELNNKTKNKKWQGGYWLNSQGIDPNLENIEEKNNDKFTFTEELKFVVEQRLENFKKALLKIVATEPSLTVRYQIMEKELVNRKNIIELMADDRGIFKESPFSELPSKEKFELSKVEFDKLLVQWFIRNEIYSDNIILMRYVQYLIKKIEKASVILERTKDLYKTEYYEYYQSKKDQQRLLRSSNILALPTKHTVRLMACSDDITHSWALPSLGIKMDCVPGRIFCLYLNVARDGVYFGQCSELCGWNHYNMPIVVYALPLEHFIVWWEMEINPGFKKKIINNDDDTCDDNFCSYNLLNSKYK